MKNYIGSNGSKYAIRLALVSTLLSVALSTPSKATSQKESVDTRLASQGLQKSDSDSEVTARSGENGPDRVISTEEILNGSIDGPIDISGEDGNRGEYSEGSLSCSEHPDDDTSATDHTDRRRGGDGGDGGNLVVFYRDIAELAQVQVISRGGEGGSGSAQNRRPCPPSGPKLPDISDIEDVSDLEDGQLLDGNSFFPSPLSIGRQNDAYSGKAGASGYLFLIHQEAGYEPEQPTQTVVLSALAQSPDLLLSKNLWENRVGATNLLADDSVISDIYFEYSGRLAQDYRLVWNAGQPASDFQKEQIELTLTETGETELLPSDNVLISSEMVERDGIVQVAIEEAVKHKEATQLAPVDLAGSGSALQISLVDRAGKSDILTTQFRLKYRVARDSHTDRPRSGAYVTRYEGDVPAEMVSQDRQRFTLDLGQLPIDAQYLQPGTAVDVELSAVRSLGDRAVEQQVTWKGQVGS